MNTPEPPDPNAKDTFAALIDAFTKLPPLLSYGGLVLIALILLVWLTGSLPNIILVVPVVALVAFLVYAFLNNRFEMEKERLKASQETERLKLEAELERLRLQQEGELAKEQLKQQTSLEKAKLKATTPLAPPKPEEPPAPATWPESYYRYVWQQCAHLHMTSIDPKAQELGASVLNLHSIFTTLDVPKTLERDEAEARWLSQEEAERRGREPALEFISRLENRRLVLLGQPGSGKSTLVKFMALCLSGAGLQEEDTNLESLVENGWRLSALLPLMVELRHYAAKGLSQRQSLWTFITAGLKSEGLADCTAALEQHLKQQGGILLLDGLDEVPEAHQRREQLREAILQFVREFPQVQIVVTSRPYAYQNPAWQLPGFGQTTLLDFTPTQINSYIDRWYEVAGPQDPNLGLERAQQYANQLKWQVEHNHNLGELAPRPLLLALMVSLHRWRGGGLLPERREQLYDASVNLLLDLWQRPKLILDEAGQPREEEANTLTVLGIDTLTLRQALSQLAYEVHRDQPEAAGTADIPHEKLVAVLRQAVPKEKRDAIPHQKIASYVRDRAGLLEDRGEGVYGFPHRTFQEFLAAMHLLDQEDFPANLVPLVRQDPVRWREATLLAGNTAKTAQQWTLVEHLFERQDAPQVDQPVTEAQWWGVFLAGQVLHDSDLLKKETKLYQHSLRQVQGWHKNILVRGALPPRDRAQAGDVLAELGDDRPGVLACDDMPLCIVPSGTFWMGDGEKSREGRWLEMLDKPYWLGQYPVTVAQFREFVQESGFRPSRGDMPLNAPANRPVVYVNWCDALAFCDWLDKRWRSYLPPGYRVTLPNEAEWEKAARGGREIPAAPHVTTIHGLQTAVNQPPAAIANPVPQREYPWGNEPAQAKTTDGQAVYRANDEAANVGRATAVGSFPAGASPVGCLDMGGNVWEWTRSFEGKTRPYRLSPEYETIDPQNSEWMLLCGGAYYSDYPGCSARGRFSPRNLFNVNSGFRVVVSPFLASDR
ncbi:MAG TPA: SUMF1/EgtB/PvdO family nonheme iron enzyme [Chloroflexota bacterium]|nr:SUMF1/EgtB/PvdO family nonheme iron enzyme [Chloroflexota bacterium]